MTSPASISIGSTKYVFKDRIYVRRFTDNRLSWQHYKSIIQEIWFPIDVTLHLRHPMKWTVMNFVSTKGISPFFYSSTSFGRMGSRLSNKRKTVTFLSLFTSTITFKNDRCICWHKEIEIKCQVNIESILRKEIWYGVFLAHTHTLGHRIWKFFK